MYGAKQSPESKGYYVHRKLYYSEAFPNARVVRILLHELGLPFESDRLNQLRPINEFAATNPGITIPVLKDGELVLFDSKIISQYLLETHAKLGSAEGKAPPLLPSWFRDRSKWEYLKLLSSFESLTEALVAAYLVRRSIGEAGFDTTGLGYIQ